MSDDFTLEKLKIREDLNMLINKIDVHITTHELRVRGLEDGVNSLRHTVNGNGKIGLVGKVDAIDRIQENQKQHGLIAKTAFIGVLIKFVWDLIVK